MAPLFDERNVEREIDSVSLTADAVVRTWLRVLEVEAEMDPKKRGESTLALRRELGVGCGSRRAPREGRKE